jgi:hypothetical protein
VNTLLYLLAAIGAISLIGSIWLVSLCWWIASGSPDTNGAPEQD